jgi:hypothetical protein
MEELFNLTSDEIELLLKDCSSDLRNYKSKLIELIIEKDSLKRKIKQLEEEKELLEMIKSGSNFDEHLVSPRASTMNTLQKRYLQIIRNEPRDSVL